MGIAGFVELAGAVALLGVVELLGAAVPIGEMVEFAVEGRGMPDEAADAAGARIAILLLTVARLVKFDEAREVAFSAAEGLFTAGCGDPAPQTISFSNASSGPSVIVIQPGNLAIVPVVGSLTRGAWEGQV